MPGWYLHSPLFTKKNMFSFVLFCFVNIFHNIIIKSSLNVLFIQTYSLFCTNIRVFLRLFANVCVFVCLFDGFFSIFPPLLVIWNVFNYDNFIYNFHFWCFIIIKLCGCISVHSEMYSANGKLVGLPENRPESIWG